MARTTTGSGSTSTKTSTQKKSIRRGTGTTGKAISQAKKSPSISHNQPQKAEIEPSAQTAESKRKFFAIIAVVVLAAILYYLKSFFVVALVNNRPITRYQVIKSLEQQGGKGTLDSLISEELIKQDAQKKGVTVSQQEIDERVKSIEDEIKKSGQSFDNLLKTQGITRQQVEEQTRLQLILKRLLADKIKVSDKEVEESYVQQKDSKPKETSDGEYKKQIREALENQKLSFEAQTYVQSLQSKANIRYWLRY